MRAGRLLRLVLILQDGRRHTAADLAEQLQVSTRTVLRDLESLSTAGVPVYATRPQRRLPTPRHVPAKRPGRPARPHRSTRPAAPSPRPPRTRRAATRARQRQTRRMATTPEPDPGARSTRLDRRILPIRLLRHRHPRTPRTRTRHRDPAPHRTPYDHGLHRPPTHPTPQNVAAHHDRPTRRSHPTAVASSSSPRAPRSLTWAFTRRSVAGAGFEPATFGR